MSKSVMGHTFDQTPRAEIPRSSFDRSHGYKTTFDAGLLIPIYVDEALPGDTFNLNMTGFARLATPIKPIMDNMYMETFFFSVPYRQVWDAWTLFNGEQLDIGDSTDFVVPTVSLDSASAGEGTIYDYMGIPINFTGGVKNINSLHFRAYNWIYQNWFRDQNLVSAPPINRDAGPDDPTDYQLLRRRKRPDYFTSCLPWPQKNNSGTAVTIPISGTAPIEGIGFDINQTASTVPKQVFETSLSEQQITYAESLSNLDTDLVLFEAKTASSRPAIFANLEEATGVSINDQRQAFQVQKMFERDARAGTRYPEIIKSHFGVTDPAMLVHQRPEFLGGGSSRVNINPTAQTTEAVDDGTPQGNLAGFGTVTLNGHGFTKSFTEHCLIIGIVNVRADITYQEAVHKMWRRQTRFDYYWPALSHLGEQAVLTEEIYADGSIADQTVFGYIPRYEEYRYKPSLITGKFRSSFAQSLDVWHLSQEFITHPTLTQLFIEDNPPIDRVIAVQSEPHFLFDAYFKLRCARPMPLFGTPGMIDHF